MQMKGKQGFLKKCIVDGRKGENFVSTNSGKETSDPIRGISLIYSLTDFSIINESNSFMSYKLSIVQLILYYL